MWAHILLLLIVVRSTSFLLLPLQASKLTHSPSIKCTDNARIADKDMEEFLNGSTEKPWRGSTISLGRRGQIPNARYSPADVVRICLKALQSNDDPQLDHGCCVVLQFRSPKGELFMFNIINVTLSKFHKGILAETNLDPAIYGRFIRSNNQYDSLIDFKSAELRGEPIPVPSRSNNAVKQRVQIENWTIDTQSKPKFKNYEFYLSNESDVWLIDAILAT